MNKGRKRAAAAAVVVVMAFGFALFWVSHAAAQRAPNPGNTGDLMITDVPGATPVAQPGPNTPVPAWAQESYNAYLQLKAKAHGGVHYTRQTYARMPDWSGIWNNTGGGSAWDRTVNPIAQQSNTAQMKAIFDHCPSFPCAGWMTAALKPAYALRYREKLIAAAHEVYWDDLNDCLPAGFPRDMLFGGGYARYFSITPASTLMYFPEDQGNRVIFTDGRGHLPADESHPLWVGDSIGFWDKDTLVVHTLYLRNMELNRNLPADSEQASVVERIRMTDPNTIQDEMTLYDPKMLYRPWPGVQTFKRVTNPHAYVDLYSCDENNESYPGPNGSTAVLVPGQTVQIERSFPLNPDEVQNKVENRVIEYGAQLLHEKAETDTQ
jgi:hypothetical protein